MPMGTEHGTYGSGSSQSHIYCLKPPVTVPVTPVIEKAVNLTAFSYLNRL